MQPFTVESVNETLELFGVAPESARSAVAGLQTAEDAVRLLTESIAESPYGAVIDWTETLEEALDALSSPCQQCGIGLSWDIAGKSEAGTPIEVSSRGISRTISLTYRPREDSLHPIAHAVEKAVEGRIRIFPLRSSYGTETYTYAILTKHDWERLLRVLGNSAFNALFVSLEGKPIV